MLNHALTHYTLTTPRLSATYSYFLRPGSNISKSHVRVMEVFLYDAALNFVIGIATSLH